MTGIEMIAVITFISQTVYARHCAVCLNGVVQTTFLRAQNFFCYIREETEAQCMPTSPSW